MADIEQMIREMSNENTAKTFAFNASEAQKARDFQGWMSNHAHEREVTDLKRAGLNPVLSANGGAQSYSAASASGQSDNSAAGLIASIYQTKLNNENAMKIAKENNRIQKEINDAQIENAQYLNSQSIAQAKRDNANAYKIAKTNAIATKYASDRSASASKYASDNAYNASVYGSNTSRKNAKLAYSSTDYGAIDSLGLSKKSNKIAKGAYVATKAFGNVVGKIVSAFSKKGKK